MKGERSVLAVAMTLPTAAALYYFAFLGSGEAESGPLFRIAYYVTKTVQFSLPVLWLAIADPQAMKLRRPSPRGLAASIAFGAACAGGILALYYGWLAHSSLLDGVADRIRSKVSKFGADTPAGFLALAGIICVVHSLLEEYYWRWFVYGRLRRHLHKLAAMIVAGLTFMAHHVVILWVFFPGQFWLCVLPFSLGVAVGGIAWAWQYERTGSLVGPWVSHFLVDAALMAVGYDLVFGAG